MEVPKKNGKSELAAAVALYLTCGDGEWGAEVYGCAADRQQASIVFDVAVDMVGQSPALKKELNQCSLEKDWSTCLLAAFIRYCLPKLIRNTAIMYTD